MGLFGNLFKKSHDDEKADYGDIPNYEDDEEFEDGLSVYDAAEIWASNGKDEDFTFGYSEEELESALNE